MHNTLEPEAKLVVCSTNRAKSRGKLNLKRHSKTSEKILISLEFNTQCYRA